MPVEPPSDPPPGEETTAPWKAAVEVLGALAGVATFFAFVGGVAFAARLRALDLPIDATVALLPTTTLIVAGVHALLLGLLLAAAILLVLWLVKSQFSPDSAWDRARTWLAASTALALVILTVVPQLYEPLRAVPRLFFGALLIVALTLMRLLLKRAPTVRAQAYLLPVLVLVVAAVSHVAEQYVPPTDMDFVSVRMTSGETTDGYYLASDGSDVFIATNVGTRSAGLVTALPRSDIADMRIFEEQTPIRGLQQDLPGQLLGEGLPPSSGRDENLVRRIRDRARDIRTNTGWVYPPILPREALEFLGDHPEFFDLQLQEFPTRTNRVPLDALLANPHIHVGRAFVTRGKLIETVSSDARSHGARDWSVIVQSTRRGNSQADCVVTLPRATRLRAGSILDLNAAVIAWGSFNIRSGDAINRVTLGCRTARVVD